MNQSDNDNSGFHQEEKLNYAITKPSSDQKNINENYDARSKIQIKNNKKNKNKKTEQEKAQNRMR